MSHTTTVEDMVFTDIVALQAAIAELNKGGIVCSLEQGATPRAFSQGQQGMGKAEYVLRLPGAQYDIGFYQNDKLKGLEARTDFWGGSVEKLLGAKATAGDNATRAKMGKLYQMYGVHAATRKAVQQGYSVRRVQKDDGTISLVMAVK